MSCDISLDLASPLPDDVEVIVGGVTYTQIDAADCGTQTGWHYLGSDFLEIRLCGGACTGFTADPDSTVVNFYCNAG